MPVADFAPLDSSVSLKFFSTPVYPGFRMVWAVLYFPHFRLSTPEGINRVVHCANGNLCSEFSQHLGSTYCPCGAVSLLIPPWTSALPLVSHDIPVHIRLVYGVPTFVSVPYDVSEWYEIKLMCRLKEWYD